MAIKRFFADSDSTITNAMKEGLSATVRGDEANMGKSDIIEVFSIFGQITGSINQPDESQELSRILIQFPVSSISAARTKDEIPGSGSVNFFLKLYNAEHSQNVPENFTLAVLPVAQEWQEGVGLDMDNYSDKGAVSWINRKDDTAWTTVGGHYHSEPIYSASFDTGLEDLCVDISTLVEEWIAGTKTNYGVGVKLVNEQEAYFSSSLGGQGDTFVNSGSYIHNPAGAKSSNFTKKFFARGSQYYFKRPVIEARWDSSKTDDRLSVYKTSNLASTEDNTNKLYIYNKIRGQFKNIPNLGQSAGIDRLKVGLYTSVPTGSQTPLATVTGTFVETGIYSASFTVTSSAGTVLHDVWYTGSAAGASNSIEFFSSSFTVEDHKSYDTYTTNDYVISISNLRETYQNDSVAHFRISTRKKDWQPTVYTKSVASAEINVIDNLYYRVIRMLDRKAALDFGTGSINHTKASYDVSGSYFNLDLSFLKEDEQYGIQFLYKDGDSYVRIPTTFKFTVASEGSY